MLSRTLRTPSTVVLLAFVAAGFAFLLHIIEAYQATLQQAHPGFGGEVVLAAGERKRQVRQQLKTAAQALGYALDFRQTKDPTRIYFRVITLEERAAHPKPGAVHGSVPRELPALCEAPGGVGTNAKRLGDREALGRPVALS